MIKKEMIDSNVEENKKYKIDEVINNNIALFYYEEDLEQEGLIDLSTGDIIGSVRNYTTEYDNDVIIQSYEELDETSINLVNVKKIRIFDTKEKTILCDNCLLVNKTENTFVLKNPYTGKYHVYNSKRIEDFNLEYDFIEELNFENITLLVATLNGKKNIIDPVSYIISDLNIEGNIEIKSSECINRSMGIKIIEINGKKALAFLNNGILTKFEYNDIYIKNNIIVFNKGNENYLHSERISNFKEEDLVLAKNENLEFQGDAVIWKEEENIKVFRNGEVMIFENIDKLFYEEDKEIIKFEKEGKLGILDKNNGYVLDFPCKNITIKGNYYILEKEDGTFDIQGFNSFNKYTGINDCEILNLPLEVEDILLLKSNNIFKDRRYVIFNTTNYNEPKYFKNMPEYVGNNYFTYKYEDGKFEIFNKDKRVLYALNIKDFVFIPEDNVVLLQDNYSKCYALLKFNMNKEVYCTSTPSGFEKGMTGYYEIIYQGHDRINLCDNFAYYITENDAVLYSLRSLRKIVFPLPFKCVNFEGKEYYLIKGEWYVYNEATDSFIYSNVKPITSFIASYETEYGTIIVKEYDESTYKYKCEMIENSDADRILEDYYNKNKMLKLKYSNLKK